MTRKLLFGALFCLFVSAPVWAQSTIWLASSSSFIDFQTGNSPGTLNAYLGWTPGNNFSGNHTLTGSLNSTPNSWGSGPSYTLTTYNPLPLTGNGSGTFTAGASGLAGSTFDVNGGGGSTVFDGSLSALSFTQAGSSNVVSMDATVTGTGSYASSTLTLLGDIVLAGGASLSDVANANTVEDEGGVIVPEPTTVLLFATGLGLMFLAGGFRRRHDLTA